MSGGATSRRHRCWRRNFCDRSGRLWLSHGRALQEVFPKGRFDVGNKLSENRARLLRPRSPARVCGWDYLRRRGEGHRRLGGSRAEGTRPAWQRLHRARSHRPTKFPGRKRILSEQRDRVQRQARALPGAGLVWIGASRPPESLGRQDALGQPPPGQRRRPLWRPVVGPRPEVRRRVFHQARLRCVGISSAVSSSTTGSTAGWTSSSRWLSGGFDLGAELIQFGLIAGQSLKLGQRRHGLRGHAMSDIETNLIDGLVGFAGLWNSRSANGAGSARLPAASSAGPSVSTVMASSHSEERSISEEPAVGFGWHSCGFINNGKLGFCGRVYGDFVEHA